MSSALTAYEFLIHERDGKAGQPVEPSRTESGLHDIRGAYRSPKMSVCAEQVIGTIRRECLDHRIAMGRLPPLTAEEDRALLQ